MKRNIFIVLTLALVCVLFVACGKEEITQQQFDTAMSKVEEAEAALSAAKAELQNLNQNGNNSAALVHLAAAGQPTPTPTPVEKTREEMTEEEKEAYDMAIIERLNAVELRDRFDVFCDAVESGELVSAYYHTSKDLVVYYPALEGIPDNERQYAALPNYVANMIIRRCGLGEGYDADPLSDYLSDHPEELLEIVHAWKEQGNDAMVQAGKDLLKKV